MRTREREGEKANATSTSTSPFPILEASYPKRWISRARYRFARVAGGVSSDKFCFSSSFYRFFPPFPPFVSFSTS